MENNLLNTAKYLKKISEKYNKNKSISEILNSFKLLSTDYQNIINKDVEFEYSDYNFSKCSEDEKFKFITNTLINVEVLVTQSIYEKYGIFQNWYQIYSYITDEANKNIEKINRKVIYSSSTNSRPIGDNSYALWNGFQIIDLDIKNEDLANKLKPILFDDLKKYHWFLGISKSASGKSLHVWTKITPLSIVKENKRIEYLCNFRHKYSYIYMTLYKYADKFDYTTNDIEVFMDMAMAKPQQGIFIPYDKDAMLNTNFIDYRLDVNFETAFELGVESIDWISHPNLKNIFSKLEWFSNDAFNKENDLNIGDVSNIDERDLKNCTRKHYKHAQRWQLANTLTNIYGYDKALSYMVEICKDTPFKELKGDVKTAEIHHKPISIWAIKQLNEYHGFNIKIENPENIYEEEQKKLDEIDNEKIVLQDTSTYNNKNVVKFNIKNNQYLSDIKDKIIENLAHITLLEAGAGYGKTEMIKSLKSRTCLILPFTSTIKSKIEKSEVTEDWLYYYGNKRPSIDELLSGKNMSMTIDKFSRLNLMELDQAGFEYIVLDESHLLFTSSYRDVMAPTIQRLANCKSKIIMMTGTPTGELIFFPNIKHIKVEKEDTRIKKFDLHFCYSKNEQKIIMCKNMAEDILSGKKVLFPTNRGNLFYEEITGLVQDMLYKMNFGRNLNAFYYKKSNYGDESMDNINFNKTIGDNDLIACTTYLSVGVDICDKYIFSVYFDTTWIPQDIEQFANRLRNNDLYIKMFLPKVDSAGFPINYYFTKELDLSFNKEDILLARDLIRTCNDMIERNNDESKSNPLIQSLIVSNKYLKYDENSCKYYIDETMYKLKIFEDRYSEYSTQLKILIRGIKYYGYEINQIDHKEIIDDNKIAELEEYLKSCKSKRDNEMTEQTFNLLNSINDDNIEIYKEIISGNLDIMKGKDENNTKIRTENKIYCESIEVVEKNIPIILSLYKTYSCDVIKDIYEYCLESKYNRINYSKLNRIRKFINIVNSIKHNRLDFPIYKFIVDSKKFALDNPVINQKKINKFLTDYSIKIANNVKDVVVDDVKYLKMINEKIIDLWKVVINQTLPKRGIVEISPFELLWETKTTVESLYNENATKTFFLQELIDVDDNEIEETKSNNLKIDETVELSEIEMTKKLTLDSIQNEIKNIIHEEYDYYTYSDADGSNERFLEKQRNTNKIRDFIFDELNEQTPENTENNYENELF